MKPDENLIRSDGRARWLTGGRPLRRPGSDNRGTTGGESRRPAAGPRRSASARARQHRRARRRGRPLVRRGRHPRRRRGARTWRPCSRMTWVALISIPPPPIVLLRRGVLPGPANAAGSWANETSGPCAHSRAPHALTDPPTWWACGASGLTFEGLAEARSCLRCSTAFSRWRCGTGPGGITRKTACGQPGIRGRPPGSRGAIVVSILGTRVLRTEDPRFLTTGGVYTEDVVDERLAGACHVFFVRSPIAHARIPAIDVSGGAGGARRRRRVHRRRPGRPAGHRPGDGRADQRRRWRSRLLATDTVRYRRRAGGGGRHRGALPGRGRRRAGRRRLRPAARRGRPRPPPRRRRCSCSRTAGTNIAGNFGDPGDAGRATSSTAARSSSRQTIVNQRVAPAPMEVRAARGRLGRGRPADRLDPEPGRAGHARQRWPGCSASSRRRSG